MISIPPHAGGTWVMILVRSLKNCHFSSRNEYRYGKNSEIYEIFRGNELRNCCVLITTRISKVDELGEFKDVHAEITGFSAWDRLNFIMRMLGDKKEAGELFWHLETDKNLKELMRVPLLLLFFCTLWKKGKLKSFSETRTNLYLSIVQYVLDHNQGKDSPDHFGKVDDFRETLAEIGKVALECLLKDDHVFESDQLSAAVHCDESRIIVLLQITEYAENLRPAGMVSFIQKSIQEFLAAWYFTYRCVPEGNLGGIEQHARTLEDSEAFENVFQFIFGLSNDGAVKGFEHFTSVRISDPTVDLSKTIPDTENETDLPIDNVTPRHGKFSDLVFDCFREVQSKAELLRHWLDCLAGTVLLVPPDGLHLDRRQFSELIQYMKNLRVNFLVVFCFQGRYLLEKENNELLGFLDDLHVPLRINKKSETFLLGDFFRAFKTVSPHDSCTFNGILRFRNGQTQFFVTGLSLYGDDHARLCIESLDISVPARAATLCSEQSCLKFLISLKCGNISLNTQTFKDLGAVIKNCRHLKNIEFEECGDGMCEVLEQVPNPSTCSLKIGFWEPCPLTSAGAERLAGVLPRFNNITRLGLTLVDCCDVAVNKLVSSFTHKTLEGLTLRDIRLTPAAAAVLGRSIPEMSSLYSLRLTGVHGSILQVKEMEALFGGFNTTFPTLKALYLKNFTARGNLAPLRERLKFFPNLVHLWLCSLNMNEHDLHGLLKSLRSSPNVRNLFLDGNPLGDRNRVESIVKQVLPRVSLWYE